MDDQQSLVNMAKQGKCVLNCVGPYRFSGKQVVDACIEAGAHCVDVSGEPEYLEKVQLQCDEAAKQKGVYIVGACGFDSIPVDMGVVHLIKNFGGDVNSVEEYVESNTDQKVCFSFSRKSERPDRFSFLTIFCLFQPTKIHYGTWASAVHGVANAKNLRPIRQALFDIEPKPPKPNHKLERRSDLPCWLLD